MLALSGVLVGVLLVLGGLFAISILFRVVVSTNEVHIVQTKKETTSYGKDTNNGNVYYKWPSALPVIGVSVTTLPVSVFDIDLDGYEAYDKGRLPFVVDVKAFFRVNDSNVAAQRVTSFEELREHLTAVVQGAVRAILSGSDIEEIMQGRSKFGNAFTQEVEEELRSWGVTPVKNIELMDIRDSKGSTVIHNIMEKKKSLIEMESRQEVAKNNKAAKISEIEAAREVEIQEQDATQQIGLRTVEAKRKVDIAEEERKQEVAGHAKVTAEKAMEIEKVKRVRLAEIEKNAQIVKAEQDKETSVITANAHLEVIKRRAEADLDATKKRAEGIEAEGKAKAESERLLLLAPVEAQTTLAKEIGENKSYQEYLISIRKIEANESIGVRQAEALNEAQIKIIANSGSATSGLNSALDVFSSNGGTQVGAMLEGFANTEMGERLLSGLTYKE